MNDIQSDITIKIFFYSILYKSNREQLKVLEKKNIPTVQFGQYLKGPTKKFELSKKYNNIVKNG